MNRRTLFWAFAGLTTLALTPDARATSFAARSDFAVVALDARSGERLWTHYPDKLSQATTELYPDYLLVNGRADTDTSSSTFTEGLDPTTGQRVDKPAPQSTPLAVSDTYAQPVVVLDNGWKLSFKQGYDQKLDFVDAQGAIAWTIQANGYPEIVTSWHDTVFWEMSYPEETVVYAYEAGATMPKWTFDPRTMVTVTDVPAHRLHFKVVGDDFYVGLHEHLFLVDPSTGVVKKQWNLVTLTNVPFVSNGISDEAFFRQGLEMATMSATTDTLVLGFEGQIVALDRPTGDLLWHAHSHTVPYAPYPLLHDQLLVVTAHENLAGPRPPPQPPPMIEPEGCAFVGPANGSNGYALLVLGLGFVSVWTRRRKQTS